MITLDDETADRITLHSLREHKRIIENQLIDHENGNKWMHQDDVRQNKKLVKSFARLIEYFGGNNEW